MLDMYQKVQQGVSVLLNTVYMHPVEWNTGVYHRREGWFTIYCNLMHGYGT